MYLNNGALLNNGEYRIEKVLAAGGFGITYLAMQVALGRKVVVKEFFMKEHCNRDSGNSYVSVPSVGSKELVEHFKEKFLKEARLIASFDHSNIIRIYDVFEENGTAYYVMEYLEGESLSTLVARCGAIDEQVALRYTRQVADALAEVHAGNLLHLDVKPANIMLNKKGEAVLIDFGISKHYDETGSQTSSAAVGISEGYAPLEQYEAGALSSFTPATDVYSLGATLYFLITGQCPPKAGDVMNDGLPVLPSDISPDVRAAIEAAMQSRRKDRPQSVAEFLALLNGSKDSKNPKDLNEETVMPSGKIQITYESETIKEPNEETRVVKKEIEQPTAKNNEPSTPKKNRTSLVVVAVLLLGVLLSGSFYYKYCRDKAEREHIAQIEQSHRDSIVVEAEIARIEQLYRDSISAVEARLAPIAQHLQDSVATVSASMMNVLYAGFSNPVSISVPGVPANKITANISKGSGSIKSDGKGGYIVVPTKVGEELKIGVTARNDAGKSQSMGEYSFRVRQLPDPSPFIEYKSEDGSMQRYRGGAPLSKKVLMSADGIVAAIDDGLLNIGFKVLSFETVLYDNMGIAVPLKSQGASFTTQQKELMRSSIRGKRFYISNVRAIGPDGVERRLPTCLEVIIN